MDKRIIIVPCTAVNIKTKNNRILLHHQSTNILATNYGVANSVRTNQPVLYVKAGKIK